MAILAGAIAPALIRYIDKSRKSNDVSSAKTIKTAIETALGNEDVYAYLTNNSGKLTVIKITPGETTDETTPKLKYKKANKDEKASKCTATPGAFYALINAKGTVFVLIGPKETPTFTATPDKVGDYTLAYPICPESCGAYQ